VDSHLADFPSAVLEVPLDSPLAVFRSFKQETTGTTSTAGKS
jgi:hypothetical protein